MQNTQVGLRYGFADPEHKSHPNIDPPEIEDDNVAWFEELLHERPEMELSNGNILDHWKEISVDELKWLGFDVRDGPPEWHYEDRTS